MKNLLILVVLVMTTFSVSAQSYNLVKNESKTHLVELEDDLYRVIIKCGSGSITQTGFYKKIDDDLVKSGIWKMYDNRKLLVKAEFQNNYLVWIKSGGVVYTAQDIEIQRLRKRVNYLEENIIIGTN